MPNLPKTFLKTGEGAIASYDFINLVEGTGVIDFYAGKGTDNDGDDIYFLSSTVMPSKEGGIESSVASGDAITISPVFELTPFNSPQVLQGTAIIKFTYAADQDHVSDVWELKVALNHFDGSTETEIAALDKRFYPGSGLDKTNETAVLTCPKTHFKIGDILRLNVRVRQTTSTGSSNHIAALGHDPLDRDGTYITPSSTEDYTQMKASIPFRVDL